MNSIVVHYKELALKGRNRPWFVRVLLHNLRVALAGLDVRAVRSVMGRIEIELGSDLPSAGSRAASPASNEVGERLRRVFGIANFSYAGRGPLDAIFLGIA